VIALAALIAASALVQGPADARELVTWHVRLASEDAAAAPSADVLRQRLYAYVRAGAEAEAWSVAAQIEARAPGDADAERYRVQLSAWDPARWESGATLARGWLEAHGNRPPAESESVRATLEHLQRLLAARDATVARQDARAWTPWAAALLLALTAGWVLRRSGREARK
jgi:hypothetical protein